MNPERLPLVGYVFRFGGQDDVIDGLLLLGPLVVALVAVAGRTQFTTAIAAAYVLALPSYLAYKRLFRASP